MKESSALYIRTGVTRSRIQFNGETSSIPLGYSGDFYVRRMKGSKRIWERFKTLELALIGRTNKTAQYVKQDPRLSSRTLRERSRKYHNSAVGISVEELDRVLQEQSGHCALCPIYPTTRRLHKDHQHGCSHHNDFHVCPKCFRGLVCAGCNRRLHDLEQHLEWMNSHERAYIKRRPILEMRVPA